MSDMAPSVNEALDRLSSAIEAYPDPEELEPFTAEWLGYKSLIAQQTRLLAEAEIHETEYELEARLDGSAVVGHQIETGFFADVVSSLQRAVLSAAETILGESSSEGTFSNAVREAATLRMLPAAAGSFAVPMVGPPRHQQMDLLESDSAEDEPVVDAAIGLVLRLMEDPGPDEVDALVDAAGAAGARATRAVTEMARRLRIASTGVRFTHRPPLRPDISVVTVRPAVARRIEEILGATQQETEEIVVAGRLVGASWPRRTFELEVEQDDGSAEIYRGSVPISLRREVSNSFDDEVRARIEVTHSLSPSGEDRPSYRLIGLMGPGVARLDVDGL